jgi:ABC-type bacteriocin/lantibiotic exporter with double-glycine peptidase domain
LLSLFEGAELRRIAMLLAVATADGVIQALGVASIMPFIAILSDPSLADTSRFFILLKGILPAGLDDKLVWVTGLFALVVLVISNALTMLDYWLSLRLFNEKRYHLSIRLLSLYLDQELLDFNRRKVSEMSTTILSEVERVVIQTLMAAMGLVADIIVAVSITCLLLLVNPWATALTAIVLGGGYLLVHFFIVREVERLGQAHAKAEAGMFAGLSQALALFKEVKIGGKKPFFVQRFAGPAKDVVRITNRYEILNFVPAQLIEVMAFGLLLAVALYLTDLPQSNFSAIGVLAFYAFAAYRLVPVLKSLLKGVETIRYGATVVDDLLSELDQRSRSRAPEPVALGRLPLVTEIRLEAISFRYPHSASAVFEDLDATIPAGRLTCVIGPSGAGKSTLLDLLLGLIEPTSGRCLVDGVPLTAGNRRQWQNGVGYVPQQVQMVDGTLAENIALGETDIDSGRVEAAARAAGIHRLAREQLASGYDTPVGDGGHTLSSGERQRVGIARALYHDPDVLVLDEATNELDAATEELVLSHLLDLSGKTVVFVTHKAAIWERADVLVKLAGRL